MIFCLWALLGLFNFFLRKKRDVSISHVLKFRMKGRWVPLTFFSRDLLSLSLGWLGCSTGAAPPLGGSSLSDLVSRTGS